MFFLKGPVPLWFLAGGGTAATSVDICVSVTYQASIGVDVLDSVDLELSALAYGLSTAPFDSESSASVSVANASVLVGIDLDDISFSGVDARVSITPIFQLSQSGETPVCVSSNYQISVSVTASIFPNVTTSVTYQISASLSVSLLIADNICVSVDYRLSIAPFVLVDVQADTETPSIDAAYGISTSIQPFVAVINTGGLVWSRTKQRYVAVRVGSFASDTT